MCRGYVWLGLLNSPTSGKYASISRSFGISSISQSVSVSDSQSVSVSVSVSDSQSVSVSVSVSDSQSASSNIASAADQPPDVPTSISSSGAKISESVML